MYQEPLGTVDSPYDATMWGPQCMQGGSTPEEIDALTNATVEEALDAWIKDNLGPVVSSRIAPHCPNLVSL